MEERGKWRPEEEMGGEAVRSQAAGLQDSGGLSSMGEKHKWWRAPALLVDAYDSTEADDVAVEGCDSSS